MTAERVAKLEVVTSHERVRAIAEAHYDFVWRSLRRLGVAASDVEDGAQRVLMVLMRRIDSVQPGAERSFLFGTAIRVASDMRKQSARASNRQQSAADESGLPADPELLLDQERARRLLDQVLDELPLELRTVLILADLEEMTMAEVAALLEIPAGTVASRLRRAREKFAECAVALKQKLDGGRP
jgi:RNA polymerase sigma-70 factor (ECF subfamily)